MPADDEKKTGPPDLYKGNSSCVDNVFDTHINCAKEACEKRELAACKTLAVAQCLGALIVSLARSEPAKASIELLVSYRPLAHAFLNPLLRN